MGLHSEAEIDRKFIAFAKLMNIYLNHFPAQPGVESALSAAVVFITLDKLQSKARLSLLFQYLAMRVKPTP